MLLFELLEDTRKIANKRKKQTTESTRRIVVKYSSYLINLQRYQRQNYMLFFSMVVCFAIMEPKQKGNYDNTKKLKKQRK